MSRVRCLVSSPPVCILSLIALGMFVVQPAHTQKVTNPEAQGAHLPDGGVVWCVGDGSAFTTQSVEGVSYPDTTQPDGVSNPTPVGDGSLWDSSPILENLVRPLLPKILVGALTISMRSR